MRKIRSLWRFVHYSIWLALLSLLFVTTVLPVAAKYTLTSPLTPLLLGEGNIAPPSLVGKGVEGLGFKLQQGRTLYEAGRFAEAANLWQQAAVDYEVAGDRLNQALSLSYLSLANQELGQWQEAQKAISQSLELLTNYTQLTTNHKQILAQILNTQGSLQLGMGQTETALNTWKQAEKAYAEAGDQAGKLGSQINQVQALQNLGMYRRAKITLEQLNANLQALPNSSLKAKGLRSLGVALQVVGDLTKSQELLEQSLAIAQQINSPADLSATLFSLGNTLRSSTNPKEAVGLYQKAAEKATTPLAKVESLLNQLSLLVEIRNQSCSSQVPPCQEETGEWKAAKALLPAIQSELANLSPSRDAIYAQVNFAQSLIKIQSPERTLYTENSARILAKAVQQAKMLKDPRAESYALGQLGYLYEQTQQLPESRKLTEKALVIAQEIRASDIVARFEGQLGKIFKQQGEVEKAIASYTEAVNNLQSLRSDLVAIPDWQFSFRESVEPVYRDLVGLLLQSNPSQKNLKQAREVIEKLQLAELDNFFREACLDAKPEQIDQIDPQAAVIYPIILPDRLAVIVSLPGENLRYYATALPQNNVEKTLEQLLESLNPFFSSKERLRLSQQVYDWLIRPAEVELTQNKVKTLVFVLDGLLRNLPMAALHDGKQYLLEKYNIALAPGLQLVASRSLNTQQLKILTGGITEARQGFSALPGVKIEVEQIVSGRISKVFLNQDFTETNLKKQLAASSFPVVHLATHGQFSSNAEQTFILSWNDKIKVKEFEELLRSTEQGRRSSIELLVLSACQTAVGDKRATLGLAGVAVRSGARSTLATLWSVQDQSTAKLMTEFYQQLSKGIGKAEALSKAQQYMMKQPKYEHPFYWAPFILVGNWL